MCTIMSEKKRTGSTNNEEKDAIHGCSTTRFKNTHSGGEILYKRTNAHTNIARLSGCRWCMNIQLHKLNKVRPADAQLKHEHMQTLPFY